MYRCKLVRFDVTPVSKCGFFFVSTKKAQARRYGSVASGDRRAEVQQIVPQAPMVPVVSWRVIGPDGDFRDVLHGPGGR